MPVQVRVDDFLFTKPEEWLSGRHTVDNFLEFAAILPKKFLLGMIPKNLTWPDNDLFSDNSIPVDRMVMVNPRYMQEKVVPAVHGYWHDEGHLNEFEGYSVEEIKKVLSDGCRRVAYQCNGVQPKVYMPPHNVVDARTVVACKELGFKAITGGPETDPGVLGFIRNQEMRYIPSLPPLEYGRSDELIQRGAVEHLRHRHADGDTVVLGLHWTWECNIGFDSLRTFMGQIGDIVEDFQL